MVGRFADANALAAVDTNGEIVALLVTVSSGLAVGANVWIAHCIGEEHPEEIPPILHTALGLAGVLGLGGALAGQLAAAPFLRLLNTPDEILPLAVLYLRIYFAGYPFLLAKGDSRRPFAALAASGILNVALNLFFVLVCGLSVAGVAIATGLSTAFSAGLTILGTCLLRIVWSFTVFEHFGTLESLYIVFPVSWCVTTALVWAGYAAVRPLKQ